MDLEELKKVANEAGYRLVKKKNYKPVPIVKCKKCGGSRTLWVTYMEVDGSVRKCYQYRCEDCGYNPSAWNRYRYDAGVDWYNANK